MICPSCGSSMVIRTARKGPYAGKDFYGCSNYPKCKEIVNITEETDVETEHNSLINIDLPVKLTVREKLEGYRNKLYDTIALPLELFNLLNNQKIDRKQIYRYNKWRIDYPHRETNLIDNETKQLILIAEKILNRGKITLISPNLEKKLKALLKFKVFKESEIELDAYYSYTKTNERSGIWLDGLGTEKLFYERILPQILGEDYKRYVIPQVHLSSLLNDNTNKHKNSGQRVDFLITVDDIKVIVELDDGNHEEHKSRDKMRDKSLKDSGYEVIRIKNLEVEENKGPNLAILKDKFANVKEDRISKLNKFEKYLTYSKISHQIQMTIIEAILSGHIDIKKENIISFDDSLLTLDKKEISYVLAETSLDLNELLSNLALLYDSDGKLKRINIMLGDNDDSELLLTYDENFNTNKTKFIIQDIVFNSNISYITRPTYYRTIENADKDNLEFFLNYIFRKEGFREGQYETIYRALRGEDTIVLLPTGSGKSIAFQLTSMLMSGVTLVIDPIVSLIDDQIDNLERMGIDRTIGITSQIEDTSKKKSIIDLFSQGEYLFCYISPERFQTEEFRNSLVTLTTSIPVPLVAIDEAHCVSEWGHDFRTAYLNIGRTSRNYCRHNGINPCLLALTGTASNAVLKDVQRELKIDDFDAIITPKTFDRKELNYTVKESRSAEKRGVLNQIIKQYIPDKFNSDPSSFYDLKDEDTKCGLIFCPHTKGDFGVLEISNRIKDELGIETDYYSGKDPRRDYRGISWNIKKQETASKYKNNKFNLLVATKSFGMGVDKPNIRYTIHYGIPNSIESFYQEAGRAGRDRKQSECIILVSNDDEQRTKKLLDIQTTSEEIAQINSNVKWGQADDVTRVMYFHSNSFKGLEVELNNVSIVIDTIGDIDIKDMKNLVIKDMDRNIVEKSVHRLLILGIIEDYTIDYSNNEFRLYISGIDKQGIINNYAKYVAGYNRGRVAAEVKKLEDSLELKYVDFVINATRVLIAFVYDTVEKGRRRALSEMLILSELGAKETNSSKVVRERILRYLESSYADEIEKILNSSNNGFDELVDLVEGYETETGELIGGIRSPKDASEIRGTVTRYLESTPDHPGLLFLRALSELYTNKYNSDIIQQNINAGIDFSLNRYSVDEDELLKMIVWIATKLYNRSKDTYSKTIKQVIEKNKNINISQRILHDKSIDEDMLYEPVSHIFNEISDKIIKIF